MKLQLKSGTVDITNWDASVGFTTDLQKLEYDHVWALQAILAGVDGSPTLTINGSDDGVNFVPYKTASTSVDLTVVANRLIFDKNFAPTYFQVVYTPGGATVGTITLDFELKTTT